MNNYSELLKDPRWQKKRLKILERDKFQCRSCMADDKTLHVHHIEYKDGKKPWEYPDADLITLCEKCHETVHSMEDNHINPLYALLVTKCIWKQVAKINNGTLEDLCNNKKINSKAIKDINNGTTN